MSPISKSSLYFLKAITDPAEEVLAYSSRIVGDYSSLGLRPKTVLAINSFIFLLAWCSHMRFSESCSISKLASCYLLSNSRTNFSEDFAALLHK